MSESSQQDAASGEPSQISGEIEPRGSLGLTQATALIVGSIIGVGIFNLPVSLAAYGPISLQLTQPAIDAAPQLGVVHRAAAVTIGDGQRFRGGVHDLARGQVEGHGQLAELHVGRAPRHRQHAVPQPRAHRP